MTEATRETSGQEVAENDAIGHLLDGESNGESSGESAPKRRGRPPKAKAEEATESSVSASSSLNPRDLVMAAVSAFADSPAALSSDFIVAAIAEWIPAPSYRKVFHAIGQQYGEAAIYYALAKISPCIPKFKRSGMALGASMAASSARVMDGGRKAIDQGELSNGHSLLTTQEIANRYAKVTYEEVAEYTREV